VWVVAGGTVTETEFDSLSAGLPRASLSDLRGGDAAHNAGVVRAVLSGERGPVRDIVLLNAAAALAVSEGLTFATAVSAGSAVPAGSAVADGLTKALADGIARAAEAIDSGAGSTLLARWSETSHRLATPRPRG
jgi:anthranilate phosphoribosyltransferase